MILMNVFSFLVRYLAVINVGNEFVLLFSPNALSILFYLGLVEFAISENKSQLYSLSKRKISH
jgi:hypothetical protein